MGALNRPTTKKKLSSAGARRDDKPTVKATGNEGGGNYGYKTDETERYGSNLEKLKEQRFTYKDYNPNEMIYDATAHPKKENEYRYRQHEAEFKAKRQTEQELDREIYNTRMAKRKRVYKANGKPVADIDDIIERNMPRGQGGRGDEPTATEGGGTFPKSNVRVKIKGGNPPNQTFPSSIMGETTPPRVKRPEGNDSGGGSATDRVGAIIKGGDENKSLRVRIKGGKRRGGGGRF